MTINDEFTEFIDGVNKNHNSLDFKTRRLILELKRVFATLLSSFSIQTGNYRINKRGQPGQ